MRSEVLRRSGVLAREAAWATPPQPRQWRQSGWAQLQAECADSLVPNKCLGLHADTGSDTPLVYTVETLFLVAASAVGLVWWVPQLVRVLRSGGVGVSPQAWLLSSVNLLLWGGWALVAGQPVVVAVEWVQAAGSIAVVCCLGLTRRTLLVGAGVAVLLVVAHQSPTVASLAAVGSVLAVRVPQLASLRSRAPHSVSQLAWVMSAVSNVLWFGWGLTGGHTTMVVGAGVSVLASTAIVVAARRSGPALQPSVASAEAPVSAGP